MTSNGTTERCGRCDRLFQPQEANCPHCTQAEAEKPKPVRLRIIEDAGRIIGKDRLAIHGKPEDSFRTIAELWEPYLRARGLLAPGAKLNRADVCAMMVLFKMARVANNQVHLENWTDGAGYSACGGEAAMKDAEDQPPPIT